MLVNNFEDSPIGELIGQTLSNVKNMIDSQTMIGEPIDMGAGCVAYPVVKITVGVVNGGGEYSAKKLSKKATRFPFAGGSGTAICSEPIGFLINTNGEITFSTIESKNITGEIIKKLTDVLNAYVQNLAKKWKSEGKNED